ncbi:hypothetical protein Vretifemale_12709 [Volvox reticuliferus]|uniref:Uncharacterized protein n=1 Tax=Volvox reticuliferus TaxID=1737510 RepID=A0A8J4FRB3_9CHLO|nr:hypothetical protein Vretifemale_12709 [Volvox reticuliferus]
MDAVAYRTRARCRVTVQEPAQRRYCVKRHQEKQSENQRRRRLRKAVASESQHEELNNNFLSQEAGNDQDDSVASNEARAPEMDSQEAGGARKRKCRVLSSPTTSSLSADSAIRPSPDDSDVVIVGEFQSKDRGLVTASDHLTRAPTSVKAEAPTHAADDDLGEDEELRIVGMVGQVVTRDLPHPRPDCAEHRFVQTSSAAELNSKCCGKAAASVTTPTRGHIPRGMPSARLRVTEIRPACSRSSRKTDRCERRRRRRMSRCCSG